ncbi:MAG: hypothetical protein ACYTG7_18670 [Planctomycetota bacterium]
MEQEALQPTGKRSQRKKRILLKRIILEDQVSTTIAFDEEVFEIAFTRSKIRISLDADNYVILTQVSQKLSSKASTLGSYTLSEETNGDIDYKDSFNIYWDEDSFLPELEFRKPPVKITRRYTKGHPIELGLEDVSRYQLLYQDGVEARFTRKEDTGFSFTFSTGFYGSFSKEEDDSYTLRFKGNKLKPGENAYRSQSKFVVSRSKYTGNLLLILKEDASVDLT